MKHSALWSILFFLICVDYLTTFVGVGLMRHLDANIIADFYYFTERWMSMVFYNLVIIPLFIFGGFTLVYEALKKDSRKLFSTVFFSAFIGVYIYTVLNNILVLAGIL